MRRDVDSPEAYVADLEGVQRDLVLRIRAAIRSVAPEIVEGLGHGMLDYPGLANLAAQKRYVALYVAPAVLARHRDHFEGVSCGKSCLRFTKLEQAEEGHLRALLKNVREYRANS